MIGTGARAFSQQTDWTLRSFETRTRSRPVQDNCQPNGPFASKGLNNSTTSWTKCFLIVLFWRWNPFMPRMGIAKAAWASVDFIIKPARRVEAIACGWLSAFGSCSHADGL